MDNFAVHQELYIGDVLRIDFQLSDNSVPLTGKTVTCVIKRLSDSAYWTGAAWAGITNVPLVEYDSTNFKGLYSVSLTPASIEDTILVSINYDDGTTDFYEQHLYSVRERLGRKGYDVALTASKTFYGVVFHGNTISITGTGDKEISLTNCSGYVTIEDNKSSGLLTIGAHGFNGVIVITGSAEQDRKEVAAWGMIGGIVGTIGQINAYGCLLDLANLTYTAKVIEGCVGSLGQGNNNTSIDAEDIYAIRNGMALDSTVAHEDTAAANKQEILAKTFVIGSEAETPVKLLSDLKAIFNEQTGDSTSIQ